MRAFGWPSKCELEADDPYGGEARGAWHVPCKVPPTDPPVGPDGVPKQRGKYDFVDIEGTALGCVDGKVIMAGGKVDWMATDEVWLLDPDDLLDPKSRYLGKFHDCEPNNK